MVFSPVNGSSINGGSRLFLVAAAAVIAGSAALVATGVRGQDALSQVFLFSGAGIHADATCHRMAVGGFESEATIEASGCHAVSVFADINANVNLRAFIMRGVDGAARFDVTSLVQADTPWVEMFGHAELGGTLSATANAIGNPFSADSDERTFIHQAGITDFTRPASITEFRRPA